MDAKTVLELQRKFFFDNNTKPLSFRREQLKKLRSLIKQNEKSLSDAVLKDLGKPPFEFYTTELGLLYSEIDLALAKMKKWAKRRWVGTDLLNLPSRCFVQCEPLGNALIISPWNYPVHLSLLPIISSMAAGNTNILKPSELTPQTSRALAQIINSNFGPEYLFVYEGGVIEATEILKLRFDKIFFTGSTRVGKIVALAAAQNLTPCTLELGGKSPALVLKDSDLKMTARRIAWGKFLNAGQTCVAPDYVLVDREVQQDFIEALKAQMAEIFSAGLAPGETYTRIVNEGHFDRLLSLIDSKKVICGGRSKREELFIEPTLLSIDSPADKIMSDEIFGPLLPILAFDRIEEAIATVKQAEKPLALYLFTRSPALSERVLSEVSFGGGCINDTVLHLANAALPFGGVGSSGQGRYHGRWGFRDFSHEKGIVDKALWFDPFLKYQPYSQLKMRLMRFIFE